MNFTYAKIIFLFIFVFSFTPAHGQRFSAGLEAGATATKISGDMDTRGGRLRLGAYGSIFTNYPVSDYSYWQLELMYIQKGSRAFVPVSDDDPVGRDYKLDLHYVEIPVVYKLELSEITGITYVEKLTFEAGLSFSKVIGHYEENFGNDITNKTAEEKPFNWGELNILAGLYYPLYENFSFHFRFSQGVTPVRPHRTEKTSAGTLWQRINQFGQYNTAFTFGFSYTIFAIPEASVSNN